MLTKGKSRVQVGRREWRPSQFWYCIGWVIWTTVFKVLFPLRVDGAHHVPRSGPVILVSNHRSGLDPFALAKACPRWTHFLAKEELFRSPAIGYVIRQWGAIPIDRFAADLGSARAALHVIRAGEVLAIFPEGTRSITGELQVFQPGAVNLAMKKRVPVVPAAIVGSDKALPKGSRLVRRHPVHVAFGPPLKFWELLPDDGEASRRQGADILFERVKELLGRLEP